MANAPSLFMSHAHEDKPLARELTVALGARGYHVWLDEVELRIGDSLVERIAEAIAAGDFVLAIVSPDSLESNWCQQELAWAASKGIADKQVVVLPIRHRGAEMPPTLRDKVWADADEVSVEELAERIACDVERHQIDGAAATAVEDVEEPRPARRKGPEWLGDLDRVEEAVDAIGDVARREKQVSPDGRLATLFQPTDLPRMRRRLAGRLAVLERAGGPVLAQCRELAEGTWQVFYDQVISGVFAATDEIARVLEATPTGGEVGDVEPSPASAVADPGAGLRALDMVAERVLDLYAQWDRCRTGSEPTDALVDKQRRLRVALSAVPGGGASLPLVAHLGGAEWNDYFRVQTVADVEPDVNAEIDAVRVEVAHGRVPPARWRIAGTAGEVDAGWRDAVAYLWEIARNDETRRVVVFISRSAMASTVGLPGEVVEAKATAGRSAVLRYLGESELPDEIDVSSLGIAP